MHKMDEDTGPPLKIAVSAIHGVVYTESNIPLRLTFENVSGYEMRLLQHFEPLPVFFAFDMVDEDDIPVPIPGAGKIDFYKGSMEYATLRAGDTLDIDINLAKVMYRPALVKPGKYTISATYHNQYGENCFRGVVSSGPTSLTILTAVPVVAINACGRRVVSLYFRKHLRTMLRHKKDNSNECLVNLGLKRG